MHQGSYLVEMSDEGLMIDAIEQCLRVVIKALKKSQQRSCSIHLRQEIAGRAQMIRIVVKRLASTVTRSVGLVFCAAIRTFRRESQPHQQVI